MDDNLSILIKAILDEQGIKQDIKDLDKIAEKYTLNFKASIDKGELTNSIKAVLPKIIADVNKAYNLKLPIDVDDKILDKSINQYQSAMKKMASEVNKIQLSMSSGGDTTTQIDILRNSFTKLGLSADEVKNKMNGVDTEVKELKNLMSNGASDSAITTQFERLQTVLSQTQNDLKSTRSEYSLLATEQQRLNLANTIEAWNQKNTKATREVREQNDRYVASLRDLNTQMTKLQFGQIQTGFKQTENSMRTLNRLGASLKDQMKQAANSFTQWISVSSAIMGVVYNTKEAVTELKELDNILTEIRKTSDLTSQQLKKLGDNAFDTASKYGKTASDYLTGVQEMYRAGFDNAPEMAELSILAQSAGDMEINSANDYLLATNAAYDFKGSVEELNKVLDSQNYITNNAAVSMQDMADATSEAASISAQYGVEINELSAMIATVASKTRETGSEVGTALRSIFVTLQDTTSKPVVEAFDSVGISMTKFVDGTEQLKTPIELLKELSVAFNELPEGAIERSTILTDIGKKYHANTLSAILSDWESYEQMLELYSSSSADGSAFREAEKSANNLSGSLNKLSNTWTDTVNNILNSDTLTSGVNVLNDLLGLVNKLTESLGSLGTISLIGGGILGVKNAGICV